MYAKKQGQRVFYKAIEMTCKTHSQTEGGENSEDIGAGAYSVRGNAIL